MGIKKAKTKDVRRITAAELGGTAEPTIQVAGVYMPQKSKQTQMLEGGAKEAAAKLVEKLRFEARVI
jgi:electron transfer flavoprotein beta subunit